MNDEEVDDRGDDNENDVPLSRLARIVEGLKTTLESRAYRRFYLKDWISRVYLDRELSPFFGLDLQHPELTMHFENSRGTGDHGLRKAAYDHMVPSAPVLWSGIYMTWELGMRSKEKSL